MSEQADQIQARSRAFALRVIRLVEALPNTVCGREIGRQPLRSATSVSANYRAGPLRDEADELTRIFAATRKSAAVRARRKQVSIPELRSPNHQINNHKITHRDHE